MENLKDFIIARLIEKGYNYRGATSPQEDKMRDYKKRAKPVHGYTGDMKVLDGIIVSADTPHKRNAYRYEKAWHTYDSQNNHFKGNGVYEVRPNVWSGCRYGKSSRIMMGMKAQWWDEAFEALSGEEE